MVAVSASFDGQKGDHFLSWEHKNFMDLPASHVAEYQWASTSGRNAILQPFISHYCIINHVTLDQYTINVTIIRIKLAC